MYDLQTGEFLGLRCEVAFIVFRGDDRELFYHMALIPIKRLFYIYL